MAVEETFNKKTYAGNGATTVFSLPTKVFALTDVTVYLKTVATGAVSTLVVDTDYTIAAISGDLDNGASIDTSAGSVPATYSDAYTLTLERVIEETQTLELEEGGDLPANELEDALDRGVMIGQQNNDLIDRSLTFPTTDTAGLNYAIDNEVTRANKVLGFDGSGNATSISLATSGTIGVDDEAGLDITTNIISAKVDDTSIEFNASPNYQISVKDGGITTAKILDGDVTTAKIDDEAITLAKMANLSNMKVVGRTTAGSGAPEEMTVNDDDDLSSASAITLASDESIKAYIDTSLARNFFHLQDAKASTTVAQTLTTGSADTRDLQEVTNEIAGASVTSSVITLPAGTYRVRGWALVTTTANDITSLSQLSLIGTGVKVIGSSTSITRADGAAGRHTIPALLEGIFTIASEVTDITLKHWVSVNQAGGIPVSTGESEVYANLIFDKVD